VFITYDIEFMMPTAEQIANSGVQTYAANSAIATATPFGVTWTPRTNSTLSATVAVGGTLSFDFDDESPLPVGSTWLFTYTNAITGANVTTNSTISLGADLAAFTGVYKNSAGADTAGITSGPGTSGEELVYCFRVVSSTGLQQVVIGATVFGAGATGYATATLTPVLSTLSLGEQMMRHRYPKLYEIEDMMTEIRLSKALVVADYARARAETNTCQVVEEEDDCEQKCVSDDEEDSEETARAEFEEWVLARRRLREQRRARIAGSHPKRVEPGASCDDVLSLSDVETGSRKRL
jgi:hypothetical protein